MLSTGTSDDSDDSDSSDSSDSSDDDDDSSNKSTEPAESPKTIVIPEGKNELLDRLRVLVAAKHAGHTNVEDEKRAILQRLFEKKWMTAEDYKKLSKVKMSL